MSNNSWCPIPWVTYSINSLGHYRVCVQANSYKAPNDRWKRENNMGKFSRGTLWETNDPTEIANKPVSCHTTSLDEVRNNVFLKEIRSYMLRGERHPVCKRCNNEDDNGILSRRMSHRELHANDGFTIDDAFKTTSSDGTITDTNKVPLFAADIRLGNLCNQKCRMCYPGESSAWYQEWYDTFQEKHKIYYGTASPKPPKFTASGNSKITLSVNNKDKVVASEYQILDSEDTSTANVIVDRKKDPYVWTDSRKLFKTLSYYSPDMKHIHMSGGEPLMITEHYEFLQGYVDQGQSKDIVLNYNTNLSNIPDRALDLWKSFKKIELRVSIDAVGKRNEYIRYPSNWEIILRNLRLLTDIKKEINLSLETITTVQMYNVLYLDELVNTLQSFDDIKIDGIILHMLHDPRYFNITTLPLVIKGIVATELQKIPDTFKKQVQGIINHMYSVDTRDALDQFFTETRIMDNYRKQKFEEFLPKLNILLMEYKNEGKLVDRVSTT